MTWQYNVNVSEPGDDTGIALWEWWKHLFSESVIDVRGSGDGDALYENVEDSTGAAGGGVNGYDVITEAGTWDAETAESWSNTEAWVRVQIAGTTHEFVIMRDSNGTAQSMSKFKILYSPTGFDDTGVANATTPPTASASDEVYILGSGASFQDFTEDAVPIRIHVACEDTAQDGWKPWYLLCTRASDGRISGIWFFDVVENKVGSDAVPWVMFLMSNDEPTQTNLNGAIASPVQDNTRAWFDWGGGGQALQQIKACGPHPGGTADDPIFPGGCPTQVDGDSRSIPVLWANDDSGFFKGTSRNLSFKGVASRTYPDTIDLSEVTAKLFVGDLIIPWEQSTAPQ